MEDSKEESSPKRKVNDVLADFFISKILEGKRQKKNKKNKKKKSKHYSSDSSYSDRFDYRRRSRSTEERKKHRHRRSRSDDSSKSHESSRKKKKRKEARDHSSSKEYSKKKKPKLNLEASDNEKPLSFESEISFEEKKPKEAVCPESLSKLKMSQLKLKEQVEQTKHETIENNSDALIKPNNEQSNTLISNVQSKVANESDKSTNSKHQGQHKNFKKASLLHTSTEAKKSGIETKDMGDKISEPSSKKASHQEASKTKRHKDSSEHSKKEEKEENSGHRDKNNHRRKRKYSDEERNSEKHYRSSRRRSRSRERERKHSPVKEPTVDSKKIDKAKLLQVARKNALEMMEKGILNVGFTTDALKKESVVSLKAGGKSVKELTDFCRNLSSKENMAGAEETHPLEEQKSDQEPFIHHPFKVKDTPFITFNIRNSVQIPVKTHAEKLAESVRTLSQQFPVSCGDKHRELEWTPVEKPEPSVSFTAPKQTKISEPKTYYQPPLPPPLALPEPPPLPPTPFPSLVETNQVTDPMPPLPALISYPEYYHKKDKAPNHNQASNITRKLIPDKNLDISALVAKRFKALTVLQHSPNDFAAQRDIEEVNLEVQAWVQSQQIPGQFTGSTSAKFLTPEELCGPPVWVKKDIFSKAAPLTEGKGMSLLKKMGWTPGEGLGKNKEGVLEPLYMDIKTDKKGLSSLGEAGCIIASKHPVSQLMEVCSKKRWDPPLYSTVNECGPSHKRSFRIKVEVNHKEYVPLVAFQNKKQAKAEAAKICLQSLGLLRS